MKSYTDLFQSKKLAEILPLESADQTWVRIAIAGANLDVPEEMQYRHNGDMPFQYYSGIGIPCWSLASLFNVLPVIIGDVLSENALRLRMDKSETDFNVWYEIIDTGMVEEGLDIIKSNPIDACYEMIIHLNELNLL